MTSKIDELVESTGFDSIEELLEEAIFDSICPAICMNENCDNIEDLEPDQREGYCEVCRTNSMQSALVLMRMI